MVDRELRVTSGAIGLVPNSTTRTPATDMLCNTTNGRAHNNSTTSQHLDMSRCWALALRCGKFAVQQVVELLWAPPLVVLYNMSVASSGVWHLMLVCWRKVDTLNTECDANCDTNCIDLISFKMVVKFYPCATKWYDKFHWLSTLANFWHWYFTRYTVGHKKHTNLRSCITSANVDRFW